MDIYDISGAFGRIEDELIASMIRNLGRHRIEEGDMGFNWVQWQAEELKALEKYKKYNTEKYGREFENLNSKIEAAIREMEKRGGTNAEQEILKQIKNGFKPTGSGMKGLFFHTNQRKLDALIKATTNDMKKAEVAILRMANDRYRRVIFDAQLYAASGAGTYEKAVDMATKDMVLSGLNCVEYKNGARHRLEDYADMAIRTAGKRAYLYGEGERRQAWGITTVIVNKRTGACPKCLPWCGKVFIDDVWSGGSAKDGDYPLLSSAVEAGLYHPRCKDSHTTYFPGISKADGKWTKKELQRIQKYEHQRALQQYEERQAEKWQRVADTRLDPENRERCIRKAELWENESGRLSRNASKKEEQERIREILRDNVTIGSPNVDNSIIDTSEYNNKFSRITDNSHVNDRIRSITKGIIKHNSGTYTETLALIDANTGKLILKKDGERNGFGVSLTEEEREMVRNYKGHIIGIHNHPTNIVPTGSDFATASARGYDFGVVATHDGEVYLYKGPEKRIFPEIIDDTIDKFTKFAYSDDEKRDSFAKAMEELKWRYGITWEKR